MSADWILGEPFNIASYAFLVYIVCELVNNDKIFTGEKLIPGKLFISFGDIHVYESHLDVADIQIKRKPFPFPKIKFNKKISNI
jgi:thymidylate synthase